MRLADRKSTFLARFPVFVKSLLRPARKASPLVASVFGQHRKFPPHARKTSGTQGTSGFLSWKFPRNARSLFFKYPWIKALHCIVCVSTLDFYLNLNCRKLSRKRIVCFVAWCLPKPHCKWIRLFLIVAPYFDYCSEVWGCMGKGLCDRIQRLQNTARRIRTLALNTRFAGILQDFWDGTDP